MTVAPAAQGLPTLIVNCRTIVSGDLERPTMPGDAILVVDGRIVAIGTSADLHAPAGARIVDASGCDAIPGLIDSHIHPSFGDFSNRMSAVGWMAHYVQAGVTTALSQGAFLLEGYPLDPRGTVALGIALARHYARFRPGGMKVHGAAISLVEGLEEDDFATLAREGVWLIAEIGVKGLRDPVAIREMLGVAHRHGFRSRVHFGPCSVEDTSTVTAAMAEVIGADITSHLNGGPNAPGLADVDRMLEHTRSALELCWTGNHKVAAHVARHARDSGQLARVILGSDSPTGAGILPRSIIRMITLLSTFAEVPPAEAVATATGNTARVYGLNTGRIQPGREADVLLIDAPRDSQAEGGLEAFMVGDLPAIGMIMIDGRIVSLQSANTLPGRHPVTLLDGTVDGAR